MDRDSILRSICVLENLANEMGESFKNRGTLMKATGERWVSELRGAIWNIHISMTPEEREANPNLLEPLGKFADMVASTHKYHYEVPTGTGKRWSEELTGLTERIRRLRAGVATEIYAAVADQSTA